MLVQGVFSQQQVEPAEIINVQEFLGDSSWTLIDSVSDPTNATVYFELLNGGALNIFDNDSNGELQELKTWMNQVSRTATIGELYECKLATTAGTYANSGTPPANNTFVDIDTDPRWTWLLSSVGTLDFTGILSVREKADTGNVKTATVVVDLDVL